MENFFAFCANGDCENVNVKCEIALECCQFRGERDLALRVGGQYFFFDLDVDPLWVLALTLLL